jgi:CDP-diacylglycerol--glycerol-3-phosphate 3-phosphatidyltransferase
MALNAHARVLTDRLVVPLGRGLVRLGATADALTLGGLLATLTGVAVVLAGAPRAGAVVLAVATAGDALDGTVARLRGRASDLGAFLDSVADRVSDAAILGAALWLVRGDPLLFTVGVVALACAQLTSYIRAKAESLGWNATVGLVERPERVIVLVLALFFSALAPGLWLLAAGGAVTVVQRLRVVVDQARAQAGSG